MPKKYEPIQNSPSATESRIQTLKTSKQFICFHQQLVQQIYEENDQVICNNKMGETALKIGLPRLKCWQSTTEINFVAGGWASNPNIQHPNWNGTCEAYQDGMEH
jgi:hypothetical protein